MNTRLRLAGLCGLLCLFTTPLFAALAPNDNNDAPLKPLPRVALADWYVSGSQNARLWMGPLYAEVLARRLAFCPQIIIIRPMKIREASVSAAPIADEATLSSRMGSIAHDFACQYVVSVITDTGDKLTVKPMIFIQGKDGVFAPSTVDAALDNLFEPQNTVIVDRFLRQMGLKVPAATMKAMKDYNPLLSPRVMTLLGDGWRAWKPDEPSVSLAKWKEVQSVDPKNIYAADAVANASLIYRRALMADAKKVAMQQAVDWPSDADAQYMLGEIYAENGQWELASQAYRNAISLRTNNVDALVALSYTYLQQNQYQRALDVCIKINQLDPCNTKGILNAGIAYMRKGYGDQAYQLWSAGLQKFPNDPLLRAAVENFTRNQTPPEAAGGETPQIP